MVMANKLLSIIFLLSPVLDLHSQQTGEVNYPSLGIKFTIPSGWKGAETEAGYLMASDQIPGLIFLMPHSETNIQTLKEGAKEGIVDEGIQLRLVSDFDEVGTEGIGAQFEGIIQGEYAKAYVAAVVNPFGKGVTIMSATSSNQYTDQYKNLAHQVAMSLKFTEPIESAVTKEWRQTLAGAKLTYLKSSYSSGASYDGYSTYSGYSRHEEILLCPNGLFYYTDNSSSSFDSGGGFGSIGGNDQGNGKWEVTGIGNKSSLNLHFNDGRDFNYSLTYEGGKTYLSGSRYFRTYDQGCH